MLKAGENIKNAPLRCGCVANTVRGNERQFVGTRDFDDGLIALFLFVVEVTLKLDIDVVAPIDRKQACDDSSAFLQAISERTFVTSRETNQSFREFLQIIPRRARLMPRLGMLRSGPQFHPRDEPAEVLVALAGLAEQGVPSARPGYFGSHMRADAS